jgi:predicted nuclease of predicted toxin-antitoxin system
MQFYLDESLSWRIAQTAQTMGVDVTSSHDMGMNGRSDFEQLQYAAGLERCLVTNDSDFFDITLRFSELQLPHRGVLILSPRLTPEAFVAVARALRAYDATHPHGISAYGTDYLLPAELQQTRSNL